MLSCSAKVRGKTGVHAVTLVFMEDMLKFRETGGATEPWTCNISLSGNLLCVSTYAMMGTEHKSPTKC